MPSSSWSRLGQRDHGALVARVQADQRLVQQQQAGAPEQGLREQQALALAAGGLAEPAPRECRGADQVERPVDLGTQGAAAAWAGRGGDR